jgi:HEAT repeat protein
MNDKKIATLVSELNCDQIIRCQKARRELVAIGREAVPSLVKALASKKKWVRWEAAKALSQIGDPAATAVLVKALEDKEFDIRWLSAEGLIKIGEEAIAPLLKALIDDSPSIWLQEGAHHVLHEVDRGNWDAILKPVMEALEGFQPSVDAPLAARMALEAIAKREMS